MDKSKAREWLRDNYGRIARKESSGCCSGCDCGSGEKDLIVVAKRLGYEASQLEKIPEDANLGLGCGNPLALLTLQEGQTVLDLGSGGGFDCFLARERVGESGLVIGVDMTPDMIELARKNADKKGYKNVQFRLGEIEYLPVADNSVDVIISNCVINLSQDKRQVFQEAFRVLKPGGKLCISDVVATGEIPSEVRERLDMLSGCISGAAGEEEIAGWLRAAGFSDIKMVRKDNSHEVIASWQAGSEATDYVASYIIEACKPPESGPTSAEN